MLNIGYMYTFFNNNVSNDTYEDIELGLPREIPLYEIVIE
jgi:hypothetical protein